MDFEQNDLLGHPLAIPSPELLQALASPNVLAVLGAARLMRLLSPVLRGDGAPGGWTTLMDGIPAVFPIPADHNLRRPHAALAGLIDDQGLSVLEVPRPAEAEIQAETRRLAVDAAKRFSDAAALLRDLGKPAHE